MAFSALINCKSRAFRLAFKLSTIQIHNCFWGEEMKCKSEPNPFGGPQGQAVRYTAGQLVAAVGPKRAIEKAQAITRIVSTEDRPRSAFDGLVRERWLQ